MEVLTCMGAKIGTKWHTGKSFRFSDFRTNWRYTPSGALKLVKNGKMGKPVGAFTDGLIGGINLLGR